MIRKFEQNWVINLKFNKKVNFLKFCDIFFDSIYKQGSVSKWNSMVVNMILLGYIFFEGNGSACFDGKKM